MFRKLFTRKSKSKVKITPINNELDTEFRCSDSEEKSCASCIKLRFINMGKWLAVIGGLPLTYVMIPISCCVRNPVASMVLYDEKDEDEIESCGDKVGENLAVGIFGMVTTVCGFGCCCLGCFGEVSPKDI